MAGNEQDQALARNYLWGILGTLTSAAIIAGAGAWIDGVKSFEQISSDFRNYLSQQAIVDKKQDDTLKDHETRIRDLERK